MIGRTRTDGARAATTALDDPGLSAAVAAAGVRGGVVAVDRERCAFSTLAETEVVTVTTDRGTEVSIFVKHPTPDDHPDKRWDREPRLYGDHLAGAGLPVPGFLGHHGEGPAHTRLFLEHVGGWPLRYHGLEHWRAAVAEVARLHVHFATRLTELRRAPYLLQLDGAHLHRWAARAGDVVRRAYPGCAGPLDRALARYPGATELLATAPLTLVHDDLAPKNVLVDPDRDPARITVVDWELAGIGCGLMDLAHLTFGFVPEEDERMVAAYRRAVRGTPLDLEEDHLRRLLALCEAHKLLYRLASSERWGLDDDTVGAWCVAVLEQVDVATRRSAV